MEHGNFCTGSDEQRVCLPFADAASKGSALRAIRSSAARGAEITHCVGTRRRKETCYVFGRKQPTNLTLVLAGALGIWGWSLYGNRT